MLFGIITLIIIFVIMLFIYLDKPNPGLKRKKSSWLSSLKKLDVVNLRGHINKALFRTQRKADEFYLFLSKVGVLFFYNLSIMEIIEKYNITNSLIKLLVYSFSIIVFFAIFPGRYFRHFKDFRRTVFFVMFLVFLTVFVYGFDK